MAGEYAILRTLREMQEGSARREESRRAHALAMMQFAAVQKQQEFQNVGSRLQMLSQVNDQLMLSSAQQFITDTGLGAVWGTYSDDGEDIDQVVTVIGNRYGLKEGQSSRVASALYAYYKANDSSSIMSLANDVGTSATKVLKREPVSNEDKKLVKALYADTAVGATEQGKKNLTSAMKVYQNRGDILAEIMEYGQSGDIDISRDIGMFEAKKPTAAAPSATPSATQPKAALGIRPPQEEEDAILDSIKDMQDEVAQHELRLGELGTTQRFLNEKSRVGVALTDDEEQKLSRIDELKSMEQDDIDRLSQDIAVKREEKAALTKAQRNLDIGYIYGPMGL